MSQKLDAILEGYKQGKWEIIEPHSLNRSYQLEALDRLIGQLGPIQAQYELLFEGDQRETAPPSFTDTWNGSRYKVSRCLKM